MRDVGMISLRQGAEHPTPLRKGWNRVIEAIGDIGASGLLRLPAY